MNLRNNHIRVLIVDNHPVYRDLLQVVVRRFTKDVLVSSVDGWNSFNNLSYNIKISDIEVLIIDELSLKQELILEVKEIKEEHPGLKIIILTLRNSSLLREDVIKTGAVECIYKLDEVTVLLEIFRGFFAA